MSHAELIGWAVVGAIVWGAGYAVHCLWRPFAACRKCKGAGRFRSASGRSWRRCPRCKGSGERVRVGRRLWTWLSDRKNDAVG
jgi:hypothetical protein